MDSPTVGQFLARLRDDPEGAAKDFLSLALCVARPIARRAALPFEDAEDATSRLAVAVLSPLAAGLRSARPTCPLSAWLRGALRRRLATARRETVRALRDPAAHRRSVEEAAIVARRERRVGVSSSFPTSAHDTLTAKQREAYSLFLEGITVRRVGERLGIGREAARERVRRALAALSRVRGAPSVAAIPGLGPLLASCDPTTVRLVRLRTRGLSHASIAVDLGLTRAAVRCRLWRLRRRLGSGIAAASRPKSPPGARA